MAGSTADLVDKLVHEVDHQLHSAANKRVVPLMQQIIDDREKMMDTLTAVDNGISNGEDELRGDISAVHDKQRKLMDHIQTREQHIVGEMQQIQNQLASMLA